VALTDNTPTALSISEQTVLGRLTGGNITALTDSNIRTLLGITAAGAALIDDANAAAQIATLGLDADIATLVLPASTTISAAGAALIDDANAAAQLVTLGALPIAGGTMSGDITLGENTAIALDPAGSADEKWSGITVSGTAGATLAVGDLCYLNSAWKWVLTDANAASTSGSVALGLCVLAAAGDTAATKMLLMGTMRSAAFPASITGGAQLYVSGTAGDMTTTQPTGVDDVIRVVGWAILTEPNTMYFAPSSDFITRTA
jgi:hypothetical protein